jgi:hypothetical protein
VEEGIRIIQIGVDYLIILIRLEAPIFAHYMLRLMFMGK